MLLLIDIGNTNITIGVSEDSCLISDWRISTSKFGTSDEFWVLLNVLFDSNSLSLDAVQGAAVSSVVPNLTSTVEQVLASRLKIPVINVSANLDIGFEIDCEPPESVGADRLCNAAAGHTKYGGPLIIVDFGTATTFDIVSKQGRYLGGIISPGPETTISSLHVAAAKLPTVELRFPPDLIGRNTETSIQAGIMHGTVAMIDGLNSILLKRLGKNTKVIATGGLAGAFISQLETVDIMEPNLTLDGLRLIYGRCFATNN